MIAKRPRVLLFNQASIRLKLLLTPALTILVLTAVCGLVTRRFNAEMAAIIHIDDMDRLQVSEAGLASLTAAALQSDLFRYLTLELMHRPDAELAPLRQSIARSDAALTMGTTRIAAETPDKGVGADLLAALRAYRLEGDQSILGRASDPVANLEHARRAALALDAVKPRLFAQILRAKRSTDIARQHADNASEQAETVMLVVLGLGSFGLILIGLFVAHRIALPVRRLTAVMSRLAHRHYDDVIPAIDRRDEIGSMARAVRVFRQAMQSVDALVEKEQTTRAFLNTVLERVPIPLIVVDGENFNCVFMNHANEVMFGTDRDRDLGKTAFDLLPPEATSMTHERCREALASRVPVIDEDTVLQTRINGPRLCTITRVGLAPGPDDAGFVLIMFEDKTDRCAAEQRIAYMAHHDALTDLPNRVSFAQNMASSLDAAAVACGRIAVLALDLDQFKEVNDTLGHAAGDALLRHAAARMRGCLDEGDTLARLGGDEFAAIQRHVTHITDAERVATRLVDALAQPFEVDGQLVQVGLSVGIAISPGVDLLKQADIALYEAKAAGRGCFRSYTPTMDMRRQNRATLSSDLRAGSGRAELSLHYQPQIDLHSRVIVGAEALMRWTSPDHGEVPPSVFIPLAEESGMMGEIGAWLLKTACAEAQRWPAHLHVAVNISPIQLRLPGFAETVRDALDSSGLDPRRLELEMSERMLDDEPAATLTTFAHLRGWGVRLALDDFGTGVASLRAVRQYKFDKLKIDRGFISGISEDPAAAAVVQAMIGLSQSLGMRVTAKGVETAAELDRLRTHRDVEAQGFHIWRPMAAPALHALLATAASVPRAAPRANVCAELVCDP